MSAMLRLTPLGQDARFYLHELVREVAPRPGARGSTIDLAGTVREFEESPEEVLAMLRAARQTIVVVASFLAVNGTAAPQIDPQVAAIEAVDVHVSEVQ
jgi:hypothetical protein